MARPTFSPDEEQRRVLDALARLAAQKEKILKEMDPLIARAVELNVPISHIAERAKVMRKTVYRHLGKRMK